MTITIGSRESALAVIQSEIVMAAIRKAHPELTLSQLAELCDPPVSKSAFNHRLRKLMELSKQ